MFNKMSKLQRFNSDCRKKKSPIDTFRLFHKRQKIGKITQVFIDVICTWEKIVSKNVAMSNHLLLTAPVMLHIYFENTATNCHPLLQIRFLQEPYSGDEQHWQFLSRNCIYESWLPNSFALISFAKRKKMFLPNMILSS